MGNTRREGEPSEGPEFRPFAPSQGLPYLVGGLEAKRTEGRVPPALATHRADRCPDIQGAPSGRVQAGRRQMTP